MFKNLSIKLRESLLWPAYAILLLWIIQGMQALLGLDLGWLGVFPREIWGLKGILFSPLIHGGWGHLLSNTAPLFVLSAMVLFFYRRVAIPAFAMIYLMTGLAVWGFADLFELSRHFHIGASGVIYGLVAFVFWNGIFRRNLKSIALALIVALYYGSMLMGILPGKEGISWESHLMGGLIGIFTSFWFKESIEKDEEKAKYSWEEEPQEKQFYFERDIFDTPKAEKQRRDDDYWYSNRS
ncbi:MAG: rhomboid family intramembrane serine protease [Saprospiraceae bacterium]|nr:rhomboid family intramembrane serine protease [Saprospiraceae bacterium]